VLGVKGMVAESEVRFTVKRVIVKWGGGVSIMSLKERAKAYFAKQPKLTKEEKLLMNKNAFQRLEHIRKVYEEMGDETKKEE
jgi:hypothetical protein